MTNTPSICISVFLRSRCISPPIYPRKWRSGRRIMSRPSTTAPHRQKRTSSIPSRSRIGKSPQRPQIVNLRTFYKRERQVHQKLAVFLSENALWDCRCVTGHREIPPHVLIPVPCSENSAAAPFHLRANVLSMLSSKELTCRIQNNFNATRSYGSMKLAASQ